jgi:hypothetical protein
MEIGKKWEHSANKPLEAGSLLFSERDSCELQQVLNWETSTPT